MKSCFSFSCTRTIYLNRPLLFPTQEWIWKILVDYINSEKLDIHMMKLIVFSVSKMDCNQFVTFGLFGWEQHIFSMRSPDLSLDSSYDLALISNPCFLRDWKVLLSGHRFWGHNILGFTNIRLPTWWSAPLRKVPSPLAVWLSLLPIFNVQGKCQTNSVCLLLLPACSY